MTTPTQEEALPKRPALPSHTEPCSLEFIEWALNIECIARKLLAALDAPAQKDDDSFDPEAMAKEHAAAAFAPFMNGGRKKPRNLSEERRLAKWEKLTQKDKDLLENFLESLDDAPAVQPQDQKIGHLAGGSESTDTSSSAGDTPPEILAARLIDAWIATNKKQIPWNKAVEITAIVTKMPEAERVRLLALDEELE